MNIFLDHKDMFNQFHVMTSSSIVFCNCSKYKFYLIYTIIIYVV